MTDLPDPYPRRTRLAFAAGAVGAAICFAVLLWLTAPADAMATCGTGKRITCVVDGDTVWIDGEKIRLADIDAPDPRGRCDAESALARLSTARLAQLLQGEFMVQRGDPVDGRLLDRHGRTLAVISINGKSVGVALIADGLARPWKGRKESWC